MDINVAYDNAVTHMLQSFEWPTNSALSPHRSVSKRLTAAEFAIDPAAKIQLGPLLALLDRALAASYRPDADPTPGK